MEEVKMPRLKRAEKIHAVVDIKDVIQWRPVKGDSLEGSFQGRVLVRSGDRLEPMWAVRRRDGQLVVFGDDPASDPLRS